MSYILEALKLSEQTRQQRTGDASALLLPPSIVEEPQARQGLVRLVIVVIPLLIIAALAAFALMKPSVQTAPPAEAPRAVTAPVPPAVSQQQLPVEPATPTASNPEQQPKVDAAKGPQSLPETPRSPAKPRKIREAKDKDGMPPDLEQQLPRLVLSGKFRDGNTRMAIVNDRVFREGDEVAPDLRIEQITDETVVFLFKGHRFTR